MGAYAVAFAPYIPLWLIAALALVSVLVIGVTILRGVPGGFLRLGLAGIVLLGLANPALRSEERAPNKDVALLIVDETPSQTTLGRVDDTRAVADELAKELAQFDDTLDVRRVVLSHSTLEDGARGTLVFEAAQEALADVPARRYAGTILVTDGQVHDADALTGLPPGPLHAIIMGDRAVPDRRLVVVQAPSFGVVDEPVDLILRVEDPTASVADSIRPSLRIDGEVQRLPRIPFNEDVTVSVQLTHRGASILELRVPELEGELSTINNRAVLSLNGVRDRLRVLLVSGEPHPGERTWRNLLKSDPSVDLVHFTILRPPEKQDGTPIDELSLIAFPTRELFEVKLNDFDLIVFDSYRRRGVLPGIYLGNIVEYVQNGGALLDAAGPGFAGPFSLYRTPLGEVLPVEPRGTVTEEMFTPQVTDEGLRHPVTARLPGGPDRIPGADGPDWGQWLRQVDVLERTGNVLMTGIDEQPLVTLNRVGDGRVAQVSSDHIWLWARGYDGGGPHAELLRRLAHWLMKEPELEEETLRAVANGERLEVQMRTLSAPNEDPVATVTLPDGTTAEVPLQRITAGYYAGDLPLQQSGLYEVREGNRTVLAAAGVLNALEFSDLNASDTRLAAPVETTGGRLSWATDGMLPDIRRTDPERPAGGSGWIGLRANGDYTVTGLSTAPVLPGWLLLTLFLGLLAGTWYRESR